jgi:hypothetical protein
VTGTEPRDADELRVEIEQTRAELGDTVEALAAKTDVKARVKDSLKQGTAKAKAKAKDTVATVSDQASAATQQATAAAGQAKEKVAERAAVVRDQAADNPAVRRGLPIGAIALVAAGILVAVLVARSRRR